MDKNISGQYHEDDVIQSLNRKGDKEVLEISSTGYGLESVSIQTDQELKFQEHKNNLLK